MATIKSDIPVAYAVHISMLFVSAFSEVVGKLKGFSSMIICGDVIIVIVVAVPKRNIRIVGIELNSFVMRFIIVSRFSSTVCKGVAIT